jgi:proteasome lid subunit RPN8/RPN11
MTTSNKTPVKSPASKKLKKVRLHRPSRPPVLTLSLNAWLKLQYLCHAADTEVGGFGISSNSNPLYIEDIVTVRQTCSVVSVEFDDAAVADFFDQQIERGRRPEQFARVWVHTHPGESAEPSATDEETFQRVFGRCNWSVMFILACGGQIYCRLRGNSDSPEVARETKGSRISLATTLAVQVDYQSMLEGLDRIDPAAWQLELKANVLQSALRPVPWFCLDEFSLDDALLDGLDVDDASLWDELDEPGTPGREEVDHAD